MTSKERVLAALEYTTPDRLPTRYYPTKEVNLELMEYFQLETLEELHRLFGDDFAEVYPNYVGPKLERFEDGSWEGLWQERYISKSFGAGAYDEAVFLPYADVEEVGELEKFRFPSPDWYDYSNIAAACEASKDYAVIAMASNSPDFINGIARCRGVEQVLMDIATEDPVYLALVEQRFEFYFEVYKRTLEAGGGKIDIVSYGDDFGTQNGLLISPQSFRTLFADKLKAFFDLAHQYGAKAMMHSCGSVRELIPDFIDLGLDILEVVQVDAAKMELEELHREFYGKIVLCGSISVQSTLPFGTPEDIARAVELRKNLYRNGGMIVAPTHHLQVGTPIGNIVALYQSVGGYVG